MTIKETRLQLGLTQKQVSEIIGVPKRTVEDWETEKRKAPDYVERLITEELLRKAKTE